MTHLKLTLCLLGSLLLAIQSSAQIPAQPGRNPNTIPPPGAGGASARPIQRPGLVPGTAARPGAAAPANAGAGGAEKQAIKVDDAISDEGVELQFPNTPISEILLLYEDLTGLKIIRDANAEQATVSIETTGVLPKDKAIMFIEKSLLLNGYAFTPAGEGMVKILAFDAKKPSMEGAPLIDSAMELPMTDQVVSHVVNLKYLSSEDATKAIDQVIPRHSYGVITPVPNAKALVITENSNTIRSIIGLLERLDNKPSETIQKTFQITRSDVSAVKEALDEILGNEEKGGSGSGRVPNIPQNNIGGAPVQAQQPNIPINPGSGISGDTASEAAPAKIIPIERRNCLLVIGTSEQIEYIGKLIEELDAASELRNFASRPLKYLAVESAMQIISDAITRTEGDGEGSGGGTGAPGANNQNTQNRNNQNNNNSLFGNNNNNSLGNNGMNSGFGGSGGLGGGGSIGGGGGNLTPLRQNNGPTSMLVGKTLLISDPVANSIFASGPPEHLRILNEIMDELDHRPQQIMISALIGNYNISNDRSFSLEMAFRGRSSNGSKGFLSQFGASGGVPGTSTTAAGATTPTTTPFDPRSAVSGANLLNAANGLSFLGGIHQGVDLLSQMLETDNNFRVISRPSVFTQNNTPATLVSGQSFPIAGTTQQGFGGLNNNNIVSNVQYQDIVLSLNIIPLINSQDELTLQISQQNSEIVGQQTIEPNVYPVVSKQELNTVIACRNGSTVLLGGLIRNDDSKNNTSTPLISSIPVLGKLFGSRNRDKNSSELLIFIEPRIVNGMNDLPPSAGDTFGNSPFSEDVQSYARTGIFDRQNEIPSSAKPKLTDRLKRMINRILVTD
jgi:general secretion pathway protein D